MSGKVPNFFILGAPKCGTTALAKWLEGHPQVFMSAIKEPHFHSTDLSNRTITDRRQYERLFRSAGPQHKAVGEASTWYLVSQEAVPNIEEFCPGARYIVMTRDPVEMAYSLYQHNYRVLYEDQSTFEEAWYLQGRRARGDCIPKTCKEPFFLQYQAACSLGSLLERLYDSVDSDRVLHISMQALRYDPGSEYRRVQKFLGVQDENRVKFYSVNVGRTHKSRMLQRALRFGGRVRKSLGIQRGLGLMKLNEREVTKQKLSEEFRRELDSVFARERLKLQGWEQVRDKTS